MVSPDGQPLSGVRLQLRSSQQTLILEAVTGVDGRVEAGPLARGDYQLRLDHPAFGSQSQSFSVLRDDESGYKQVRLMLQPATLRDAVTVTSNRGFVEDAESSPNLVTVRERRDRESVPLPTIGHALEAAPGIHLQQSTYGQVSPFLRGLTGYQVLNLVDGIRFNNSTFRSGPNQYLALVEPSQVQ
ncbi:MAG: TonB-dependent receptor plug domain-containing protein, partial [Acidobacteriota bacterium]